MANNNAAIVSPQRIGLWDDPPSRLPTVDGSEIRLTTWDVKTL